MAGRSLEHFIAVAQDGSFGRAAQRLGVAQPALSQSIQRLEKRLGVQLLERTGRGARLTPSGEAFLPDARVSVAASERAARLAVAAAVPRRKLRLGVITPSLWGPLGEAVRVADALQLGLELVEGTTPELVEALAAGELDVSFISPRVEAPARLRWLSVSEDPVVAALPQAFGELPETEMLEYAAQKLILFPRVYGPAFYDEALAMFSALGFRPQVIQESPRMLATLALVSAGVGASVVVRSMARKLQVEGVVYRPLPEAAKPPRWAVALAYMPPPAQSPAAEFTAACRKLWRPARGG